MKMLITLLIAAVLVAIGIIGFAYSGVYDVSARSTHGGLVKWLLSTTSHASIERRAGDIEVPDLSDAALARAGVNDFNAMCVGCHGAPGRPPEAMGKGLNPPAPDLAESAEHMNPAELFWVTKHGIKMTGMPAWGVTHDDAALWPVVAFMTTLPDLDAEGYQAFLTSATGMGHHAKADDTGEHDHGESEVADTAGGHDHGEAAAIDHHDAPGTPPHDHSTDKHDEPATKEETHHDDDHEH